MLTRGLCGDETEVGDKPEVRDFSASFDTFPPLLGISITGTGAALADDVTVSVLGFRCAVRFGSTTSGSFESDFFAGIQFFT